MMDLDQLQSVRDRERQTDKLQQLRETFYADAAELIADLRERREAAAAEADDPFSDPEVGRLTDRIDTAEQTVEAIYEKRVGKIVKAASFAAADLPAESEGMTAEEQALFDTLVDDIKENRRRVLETLSGEREPTIPAESASDGADEGPASEGAADVSAADAMGGAGDADTEAREHPVPPEPDGAGSGESPTPPEPPTSDAEPSPDGEPGDEGGSAAATERPPDAGADGRSAGVDVDRRTVRITDDVGEIFGVDEREYHLAAGDVVTLPAENADPLVDRDAAEPLE